MVILGPDATWALRTSDYPFWRMLRARLDQTGIDPQAVRVIDSFEEGPTRTGDVDEVGVLLTSDRRLIQYRYSYKDETWRSWDHITNRWRETPHAKAVQAAARDDYSLTE